MLQKMYGLYHFKLHNQFWFKKQNASKETCWSWTIFLEKSLCIRSCKVNEPKICMASIVFLLGYYWEKKFIHANVYDMFMCLYWTLGV
jgi:hypothetical protein